MIRYFSTIFVIIFILFFMYIWNGLNLKVWQMNLIIRLYQSTYLAFWHADTTTIIFKENFLNCVCNCKFINTELSIWTNLFRFSWFWRRTNTRSHSYICIITFSSARRVGFVSSTCQVSEFCTYSTGLLMLLYLVL